MARTEIEKRIAELLIGDSVVMQELRAEIAMYGPSKIPVLISGPTGSGKELVAQALHIASGRKGPYVPFNVCALSESMFEDALFGHVRGAFTGAVSDVRGYMREADGGTLLLDEISGLPLAGQAKLLRAVETGVFRPVGSCRDVQSDFRVLAATNEDVAELVDAGRFRADLMYRLGGIVLRVPSLGERAHDIPALVRHLTKAAMGNAPLELPDAAIERMIAHEWHGNVRELRRVVERLVVSARSARCPAALVEESLRAASVSQRGALGVVAARQALEAMLWASDWDAGVVAEQLGVHRATVYRQIRRLGLARNVNQR